ncbi:hypothetical protein BFINE_57310 [Bacteroides finegoldii DSM 17565]|nr:hypothetical protein BFINE_57310 [Bacteroides finegoldii DSM 17565]
MSGSFYYANTYNQTFDPELPVSARYDKLYVQTGYVRNYGFEAMLAYNHRWGDFGWDTSFTYSTNKNEIVELVRNYVHPETGVIYNVDKLELKTNEGRGFGKAKFILKEGGTLGDLYTHADLKRDINGNVLIDDDGNVTAVDNAGDIKLEVCFRRPILPGTIASLIRESMPDSWLLPVWEVLFTPLPKLILICTECPRHRLPHVMRAAYG